MSDLKLIAAAIQRPSMCHAGDIMGENMLAAIPSPPPVTGYRQLTPEDVALMNEVRAAANALGAVLDKLAAHQDTDKRAVSIAKTEAQTASMWASRAITRPSSFA